MVLIRMFGKKGDIEIGILIKVGLATLLIIALIVFSGDLGDKLGGIISFIRDSLSFR
jgi:hypothetical protein